MAALFAGAWLAGCGGGKSAPLDSANAGQVVGHPDPGMASDVFIGEANFSGLASQVKLRGVFWGRLVSVADSSGEVRLRDFLISSGIRNETSFTTSTGVQLFYCLDRNAVTDATTVYILTECPDEGDGETVADVADDAALVGSTEFDEALRNLEAGLTPIFDKSLEADEIGPFSMVPRNSAIALCFDDLLEVRFDDGEWKDRSQSLVVNGDTGQISKDLIKLQTGYPPVEPFETRIIADPNHGNLADFDNDGEEEFHTTRLIISATVSQIEATVSNPPLAINAVGLPASTVVDSANLALRIPTGTNPGVGQTRVLKNASGHALSYTDNGSTDEDLGTPDVVRALRSGGTLTQDANNGFLLDEDPPEILGDLGIDISLAPVQDDPVGQPDRYRMPELGFSVLACATSPNPGDVIVQGSVRAVVFDPGSVNGATVEDLVADVIVDPDGAGLGVGGARLQAPFDSITSVPPCYLSFSPIPASAPNIGVQTNSKVFVRFSEPMDPSSIRPYDTFTVTRTAGDLTPFDYAVGSVVPAADLRAFSWEHPNVPFAHEQGSGETYYINLASGANGPTDLAGNPLADALPQTTFSLLTTEPSSINGGFAMRFHTADEFYDDGQFELRNGQLLYDPINERILPRPVSRFDVAADRNQPVPSVMTQFVGGIQTPLSKLGSKLQTLWRYCDLGFSLTDETNINMDVEGLSWAPVGGSVVTDEYDQFAILLYHCAWLPDEILDINGFPQWPASGVKPTFNNNPLDLINDPGTTVHPKNLGYTVNPANLYTASSGTSMLPFPLNQDLPLDQYRYYTWRDTALTALAGSNNNGAIPDIEGLVVLGTPGAGKVYNAGEIPSVGLPILMEFRCYPSDEALGLNALDISLAANSSARPNFRAFSTGGYDNNNNPNFIDPDTEDEAQGGYNPTSTPPGNPTPPVDNSFYVGEMSLVTRVSRIHTVWFDTTFPQANFAAPLMEPAPSDQPSGTSVVLAYRGASQISDQDSNDIRNNAVHLDFYGNSIQGEDNSSEPTLVGSGAWVNDITQINSARYFQVRISFVSNAATEQTAELQSLAFAYFDATQ